MYQDRDVGSARSMLEGRVMPQEQMRSVGIGAVLGSAPKKQSDISIGMDHIETELDTLVRVIDQLHERLGAAGVLSEQPSAAVGESSASASCKLGSELHAFAERINQSASRVLYITRCLEL